MNKPTAQNHKGESSFLSTHYHYPYHAECPKCHYTIGRHSKMYGRECEFCPGVKVDWYKNLDAHAYTNNADYNGCKICIEREFV